MQPRAIRLARPRSQTLDRAPKGPLDEAYKQMRRTCEQCEVAPSAPGCDGATCDGAAITVRLAIGM
eukprot:7386176-Prymnesium_polylepis.4